MPLDNQARIAIIGAGLGGVMTAIFLQKFGYEVTVYEQAESLQRIGAGINLGPNISRVFGNLGMLEKMAGVGLIPRQRYSRDGFTGEVTYNVQVEKMPELYGAPHLIMHRADLQEILTDAVAPGTVRLGKKLVDLTETGSTLSLSFADGSTADADFVIGADGINSRIREILLGPEKPTYSGSVAHRSIFPIELLNGLELPDHQKLWGHDRHILIYYITYARDVIYFVTGVPDDDWEDDFTPRPADMNKLRAAFDGFHSDVVRVLEAAPSAMAWPILERAPLPLWSRGRIVMLGDACHPMRPHMGQGAAMAMEDGVMLARCIDHFNGQDPASIFSLYEAQRRDRTSRVQARSAGEDWLRFPEDAAWLYDYDVIKTPLVRNKEAAPA